MPNNLETGNGSTSSDSSATSGGILHDITLVGEGAIQGSIGNAYNGVKQLYDHLTGDEYQPTKLFSNQDEINHSWSGNIGSMIGTSADYLALAATSGRALGSLGMTGTEAGMLASGTAGAVQGGLFQPTNDTNFYTGRVESAAVGGGTGLAAYGAGLFGNSLTRGVESQLGAKAISIGAGALSGAAIGAGATEASSFLDSGKAASLDQIKFAAALGAAGGALGGARWNGDVVKTADAFPTTGNGDSVAARVLASDTNGTGAVPESQSTDATALVGKTSDEVTPPAESDGGVGKLIADSASVHPSASIAEGVSLGHNTDVLRSAAVSANATVGADTVVGPGGSIGSGAAVGNMVSMDRYAIVGRRAIVGDDTTLGANSMVGGEAQVGAGGEIGKDASVSWFSKLGSRVRVLEGAKVGSPFGPGATVGAETTVERGAEIGGNSSVGPRSLVEEQAKIGSEVKVGSNVIVGSRAQVDDFANLGDFVHVGNGAHVESGAALGDRVQLGDLSQVRSGAKVGANVRTEEGVEIGPNSVVEDGATLNARANLGQFVQVGEGAVVDTGVFLLKGSKVGPGAIVEMHSKVGPNVTIGAGAQVRPFTSIGEGSVIEPGAVAEGRIPRNTIVRAPARVEGLT